MTHADFMKNLRSLAHTLSDGKLLQQIYSTASLRPSEEFVRYAMSENPDYAELYRIGLRNRDYNFLLADYSYLQFAHGGDEDALSMRYAYYSNPFATTSFEETVAVYDGADYELYLQLLEESEERGDALVIRFEVATKDYLELRHPAAHFHIGLHDGRWPADKILSPTAFTLFVSKLFYPAAWDDASDELFADAKHRSTALGEDLFSPRERRHIYVA